jgi:hypothetical protein
MTVCTIIRLGWKSLVGIALIVSALLAVSGGNIAVSIWLTLRALGLLTLIVAWTGIIYENVKECISKQKPVTLLVAGIFSLLLGISYITVGRIDGWGLDPIRWSLFSSITYLLLLFHEGGE